MVRKVFLNVAVCLYALLGFSLSVFTMLLSLLGARQHPKPVNIPLSTPQPLPRGRPATRTLQSSPDKPPPMEASSLEDKQRRRKMLAAHRRSRSIPLITLDYFGSTENLHQIPDGDFDVEPRSRLGSLPVRKPLTFVLPPPPGRDRDEGPWSADSDREKSGFSLANLFSKEKKTEKENMRKVRNTRRTLSPPASPKQLDDSEPRPLAPRKRWTSDASRSPSPVLSKEGHVKMVRAPMRRVSSAPTEERLTMRFDLTFSRTIEKKKSGSLRTQPYEAPFFCPPPAAVPSARLKSRSALDLKKPSRSLTLKT